MWKISLFTIFIPLTAVKKVWAGIFKPESRDIETHVFKTILLIPGKFYTFDMHYWYCDDFTVVLIVMSISWCDVVCKASCAARAHLPVRSSPWSKLYRRLDYQLCQIKNYNLTYALFALEPPAVGWDLACHHDRSRRGGTGSQPQQHHWLRSELDEVLAVIWSYWEGVLWLETVVGISGRGVPISRNLLDINAGDARFFRCCFSCNQYLRVRFVEATSLFYRLLHLYCYNVFIWLSTQAKRKLWRLVSLASGREPS